MQYVRVAMDGQNYRVDPESWIGKPVIEVLIKAVFKMDGTYRATHWRRLRYGTQTYRKVLALAVAVPCDATRSATP